jgi:hypothetical protein
MASAAVVAISVPKSETIMKNDLNEENTNK